MQDNKKSGDELNGQPVDTQPGSPNFDGAAAFEAFQVSGGYEEYTRAQLAKLLVDAQPGDAT